MNSKFAADNEEKKGFEVVRSDGNSYLKIDPADLEKYSASDLQKLS